MEFLIIGSGAIGGSVGAYLVRGGHDVVFVDADAEHVCKMQAQGLRLEGRLDFTVPVRAALPHDLADAVGEEKPDTVILAVKSQDTLAALASIVPFLSGDSFVLSMQNGLNPREIARQIGAGRTVATFVNSMGTDYLRPGCIMFGGPGTIYIGELDGRITPRVERLVDVMKACFVENTHATDNVWGYLWGKEGFSAMLFAGAVTDIGIADLLADPLSRSLLADIAGEVVRVADAEGIRCEPFDGYQPAAMRFTTPRDWAAVESSLAELERRYRRSLKPKSGIWRDLVVRRRPTEVDAQLGIVSTLAAAHEIAAPLIERVIEMIHEIERGARPMNPSNLEELRELDRRTYPGGMLPV